MKNFFEETNCCYTLNPMIEDDQFYEAVRKFRDRIDQQSLSPPRKAIKLYQLYTILISRISDETKVQFTSLFARLSYLVTAYEIPARERYLLHSYRKIGASNSTIQTINLGDASINILLAYGLSEVVDLSAIPQIYKLLTRGRSLEKLKFKRELRAQLQSIDTTGKKVVAQLQDEPFEVIIVAYDRPDRNEDYTSLLEMLDRYSLLPLTVNLINVEIDGDQVHYPESIVFEPDFMYDVTAISECFGAFANHQAGYLLRKFSKRASGRAILIGNLSNYFLDQLVYHPDASFEDFIQSIFMQDPLAIAILTDQEVREMIVLLERHFEHIKEVVNEGFSKIKVAHDTCEIEPSFYSAKYGIQGRLDLFSKEERSATIIELKSGSSFRPNNYGLSNNHYHQTLLYDLLIESVYGLKLKRNNFILYSKESTSQLRYAPALKSEQREAIKERNQLYIHDRRLLQSDDFISYYQEYARDHAPGIKGFLRSDYESFFKSFKELDPTARAYCNLLLQFTLRELFLNKLGNEGAETSKGLAGLWMQDLAMKKDQFNILNHLVIVENQAGHEDPILTLQFSDQSATLSNFRVGDLGVFYPHQDTHPAVLHHQVFKVTLLALDRSTVKIRLRSRQEHTHVFSRFKYWHIEHDTLDNGYYDMSRSIYEFASAPGAFRDLLMGRRPPELYDHERVACGHNLTQEQSQIFSEVVRCKDYYLLWGPPGTGKTSVMLREIAHHYITHEKDRVLFLAYTNRAVDEICEALYSIEPRPSFIRIGSRYSTHEKFHPHLLEQQIAHIKDRKSLREVLAQTQVYVGTIASVVGKVNLFELIKFDLAVIDEASQILETSLIGLLSRVSKFILIGDHLQLPAIVQQKESYTRVEHKILTELGFRDLSASLFERMYTTALSNGWEHAIGQLSHQGRMHVDIMGFANQHFYNNSLQALDLLPRLTAHEFFHNTDRPFNRLEFYPSKVDLESESIKINRNEAKIVRHIITELLQSYHKNDKIMAAGSIGVITPYRAQIAAIRQELDNSNIAYEGLITIDTVERYQGGARDIIIMSCCMNYSFQLKALVSLSDSGIDRKLNVAITRAREQFILIGNEAILCQNKTYQALIETAVSMGE